jgi:hypothetical protein
MPYGKNRILSNTPDCSPRLAPLTRFFGSAAVAADAPQLDRLASP